MTLRSSFSLLFDGIHGTLQNVRIRNELRRQALGLIVLDVVGFGTIEQSMGRATCDRILAMLLKMIRGLHGSLSVSLIAVKSVGDDFSLFVKLPSVTGGLSRELFLHEEALAIKRLLEQRMAGQLSADLRVQLYVGSSLIQLTGESSFQAAIYNAMKQANYNAKNLDPENQMLSLEFNKIIAERSFHTLFQPIVSLRSGAPFGVEALTRGPHDSFFNSPVNLFDFAQNTDRLVSLDTIVAEASIANYGLSRPNCKLFLNMDSRTLIDSDFDTDMLLSWLRQAGVTPQDVVLEITERNWVADYGTFNTRLDPYRKLGLSVAVDDVGMGYSSLQAITELKPDFIKVDRSLIQHIDREMFKSVMLETLMDFAQKVNCLVIAEGIETEEELTKVIQLGVHYGQGFLLGRPSSRALDSMKDISEIITLHTTDRELPSNDATVVERLTRTVQTFESIVTVSEVAQYFQTHKRDHTVVIADDGRPVGIVMRDKLLQQLATQYGVPLYWHRGIRRLMDATPLTIESTTALDLVSRRAMERDEDRVYDSIVVTSAGELQGIITIQDILSTINTVHLEQARGANPLTGLPGNRTIQHETQKWMARGESFFIIYADIDHFKWYNDRFGFHRGDHVIQFLADILKGVWSQPGIGESFVGHIGGDDFMVLMQGDPATACAEVIEQFDSGIAKFYGDIGSSGETGEELYVYDRRGERVSSTGLTLSLCVLDCPNNMQKLALEDVSAYVAEVKHSAKVHVGSTYIVSRFEGTVYEEVNATDS